MATPDFDATVKTIRFAREQIGKAMKLYAGYRDLMPPDARREVDGDLAALAAEIRAVLDSAVAPPARGD